MNLNLNDQKSLRSGTPQAYSRKSGQTFSKPDYSRKIRIGEKVVGTVEGNEFVKKVHSRKHFLRKPIAIAFDVDSLTQAQKLGATRVKIIDLDTSNIYTVTITLILQKGFYFNRGYGKQVGLTLNYWSVETNQSKRPMKAISEKDTNKNELNAKPNNPNHRGHQPRLFI